MKTPGITRRELVIGSAGAGIGLLLLWQAGLGPTPALRKLLRQIGQDAELRAPDITGEVSKELGQRLWALFTRVADRWRFGEHVAMDEPGFLQIIREKTTRLPSYLTEYQEAGVVLAELGRDKQLDDTDLEPLFSMRLASTAFDRTRLGRLHKFVIAEFIELQMASGAFRVVGYRNYRGFAGGPLSDPASLPYRSL